MTAPPLANGPLVNLPYVGTVLARFVVFIINSILGFIGWLIPPLNVITNPIASWLASDIIIALLAILLEITLVIAWATVVHLLTFIWIERKVVARMQDRRGPQLSSLRQDFWTGKRNPFIGFLQQIADALKLIQKENITPTAADKWMFHLAPGVLIASTVFILAVFPWSETFVVSDLPVGLLFVFAGFSLAPLAILMASWAQNNKYTLLGGMRAGAMMMSYEIPMVLSFLALVVMAGTLDPILFVRSQEGTNIMVPQRLQGMLGWIPNWYVLSIPGFLALLVFVLSMVAELERVPFDVPEAEEELVSGWLTEYGGMRFGMVYGFKWLRTLLASALVSLLFFGGWSGPVLPQEVWFLIKTYLVFLVFIWVSWSVPRIRIDQILHLGWHRLIPFTVYNIFLAGLWVLAAALQSTVAYGLLGVAVLVFVALFVVPTLRVRGRMPAGLSGEERAGR